MTEDVDIDIFHPQAEVQPSSNRRESLGDSLHQHKANAVTERVIQAPL